MQRPADVVQRDEQLAHLVFRRRLIRRTLPVDKQLLLRNVAKNPVDRLPGRAKIASGVDAVRVQYASLRQSFLHREGQWNAER
ncbi:hypothetical protein D3C75_416810 [compost metagenome]